MSEKTKKDRSEYYKRWYREHKEQRREYMRQYYEEHKEKLRAYNREWRQEHPEAVYEARWRYFEKFLKTHGEPERDENDEGAKAAADK